MYFIRSPWYSFIAGAILLAAGIWFSISPVSLLLNRESTTATVTYVDVENGKSRLQYYAQVEFTDGDGARVSATLPETDDPKAFTRGQTVPIVYDRTNPSEVASANASWLPLVIPGALAVVGFGLFASGLVRIPRNRRRPAPVDSTYPSA